MYWLRLGYWKGSHGQSASIYISNDFQSFMMEDYNLKTGEYIYINNSLPVNIKYDEKVQPMVENFVEKFNEINCEEDINNLNGVIDFSEFPNELPY